MNIAMAATAEPKMTRTMPVLPAERAETRLVWIVGEAFSGSVRQPISSRTKS
jgi:hypothetical protein